MAHQINEAIKGVLNEQPLPFRFYADAARKAAKQIRATAREHFAADDVLRAKAFAVATALEAYGDELTKK